MSVNIERTMEHRIAKKEKKLRRASLLTNSMYFFLINNLLHGAYR